MRTLYDLAVVGGGPAGAVCAALSARAGMRTLVLEKGRFPREKVCGDCLNPGCWPILEEAGVAAGVRHATHARLGHVGFYAGRAGCEIALPGDGEVVIRRSELDEILLRRCEEEGACVREGTTVSRLERRPGGEWRIETGGGDVFHARTLAAADGRNSTVARLLGVAPPARRGRVGLQAHVQIRGQTPERRAIELHLLADGYCGIAPVGGGLVNYCMVGRADRIDALRGDVVERFRIPAGAAWRSIAPLERAPIGPLRDGVLYLGDAARVVEPFTGEGIYYALRSGALAARCLAAGNPGIYPSAHARLYRGRIWINAISRRAVLRPGAGGMLLRLPGLRRGVLEWMVRRVVQAPGWDNQDNTLPISP